MFLCYTTRYFADGRWAIVQENITLPVERHGNTIACHIKTPHTIPHMMASISARILENAVSKSKRLEPSYWRHSYLAMVHTLSLPLSGTWEYSPIWLSLSRPLPPLQISWDREGEDFPCEIHQLCIYNVYSLNIYNRTVHWFLNDPCLGTFLHATGQTYR